MHKLYGVVLVAVATIVFSGCSLLGGTTDDAMPATTEPTSQKQMQPDGAATQPTETVTPVDTSGQQLPVAPPDPAADTKGMQETQDDAPTGVQTR